MKKILLALTATFAVCLAVFAGKNMCVKKQNGDILRINVDDVYEVYFEDIFNPDTSSIIPPFIEPTVADTSAYAPLNFWITSNSTVELTRGYYYDLDSVSIPAKVKIDEKIYDVTEIDDYAFAWCDSLKSIIIPESINEIKDSTFWNCSALTNIIMPGIKVIKYGAFYGCSSLTNIELNNVDSICVGAFGNCRSLKSINVNDNNPNFSSVDGILYNKEKTQIIAVPQGIKGSISIPSSVTSIGYGAFSGCSSLTSIKIPSGVTSIGYGAFYNCSSLTSIEIPSSVTSIGYGAFSGCSSLTSIEIPSSVTEIGDYAFDDCSSLTTIKIPSSVTSIGYDAFSGCSKLKPELLVYNNGTKCHGWIGNSDSCINVVIPEGVTEIGYHAFYNCSSLTSIEIPSSVTSIDYGAFSGCKDLDVVIDNSKENVEVGWNAFYNVKSVKWLKEKDEDPSVADVSAFAPLKFYITSDSTVALTSGNYKSLDSVNIPAKVKIDGKVYSVTEIGSMVFVGYSLTHISIPESIISIADSAFTNCSNLTSIAIPSSVTSIGEGAFAGCSSLTSIEIPSSVSSIGSKAFEYCENLDVVIDNSKENVKFFYHWGEEATMEESYAFNGVKSVKWLKEIDEDPSVADVSAYAPLRFEITSDSTAELTRGENWDSYRELVSVNIPSKVKIDGKVYSVTSIGWGAFDGCSSLTSIEIPSSVTSIGSKAFDDCSSLTSSIKIPSSVTSIGSSAFAFCSHLTSIEIPSSVTEISDSVFYECKHLIEINIPESVTSIGSSAFAGCSSLTSIDIPSGVTEIGDFAFGYCSSLTSIEIPSGVTEIGWFTFRDCSNLTSIDIPSTVTKIGDSAFDGCSSLSSIEIPSSVTKIGKYAFYNCEKLDVVIDNSKENVKFYNWGEETTMEDSYAFEGVKSVNWKE